MASRHSSRSTSTKSWFWNESNSWPQPQVIMLHVRAGLGASHVKSYARPFTAWTGGAALGWFTLMVVSTALQRRTGTSASEKRASFRCGAGPGSTSCLSAFDPLRNCGSRDPPYRQVGHITRLSGPFRPCDGSMRHWGWAVVLTAALTLLRRGP
jgi:hypothetical protein